MGVPRPHIYKPNNLYSKAVIRTYPKRVRVNHNKPPAPTDVQMKAVECILRKDCLFASRAGQVNVPTTFYFLLKNAGPLC